LPILFYLCWKSRRKTVWCHACTSMQTECPLCSARCNSCWQSYKK